MNLLTASFNEISVAVNSGKISAAEVTKFFMQRAEKLNPILNAFTHFNTNAIAEAEKLDAEIASGQNQRPLAGVVFGIKDMLCTKGMPSTAASKMLQGFIPPYDATVVARLKSAGAIVLGKLNQDEFAMGSSNENSFYGPCKNPWNTEYVPGGSSGGSASAQSARLVMGAIGTDTGGSIRQPSNFCGIVGIKPTYGRVSRYGIVSYASSLDQAGPMTSTVSDAAKTLEIICGADENDSTTSKKSVDHFFKNLSTDIKGLKIGLIKEFLHGQADADIEKVFNSAVDELKKMGAEIIEISIPLVEFAVPMYYLISASEASSNLARYDGVKYGYRSDFKDLSSVDIEEFYSATRGSGFGAEVKRRIMLGTYCLSSGYFDAYYKKACQVRRLLKNQYEEAFKKCDVMFSPVTTTPAFKIGEKVADPLKMYFNDFFTTSTNLAGLAGMSVPFGLSSQNLPIGVQLTSAPFEEQKILNIAYALESVSPVQGMVPNVY
jgi:aspartyl-tRNA(Asn)/glutamyl-tRNA(Gln) amidotransferase subunit A